MKAELLAIGSELLGPLRAETNSLWLTERLLDAGIEVAARAPTTVTIATAASCTGSERPASGTNRARPTSEPAVPGATGE